jgi:ribonucleoside-triphosphate reductase
MEMKHYELAKCYIVYRYNRALVRKSNTTDESILSLLRDENKELREENSNKNTRMASTERDYIAGEVSRDLTKRVLLPEKIVEAHESGLLHFHDMDYFIQPIFNCCLINIQDMLDNGTVMNGKMIESPKSFHVACIVTSQIIATVASNQYGGQSVDIRHLGKYLRLSKQKIEKRIKKFLGKDVDKDKIKALVDEELKKELASGVQTIQYQINTLMTTNGQAPFVTLFMYLRDDDPYIEENAMIIEEILNQRLLGVKNEVGVYVTPAFPKLVYVLDENNNLSGGKYDYLTHLAVKCSAKRMYPDYISAKKMRENYEGNVFSPMGCRSFLSPWKDENGNYKFEGRFNQGVVSINLPQIGIIADGDEELFWKLFDERLDICREALMCRHHALLGVTSDVSPIHWQHGAIARLDKGEKIDKYLMGGYSTLSLGYIGLYELTKVMKGVSHTDKEVGLPFAKAIMQHMKDKCAEWKKETGLGFALYGTPAESLCYRFAKIDKDRYGKIKDITDKGYYTNSYHIDVREHIDAFSKLEFETELQKLSTGGAISYIEVGNMQKNLKALEEVVKYIYENVQYAEFNTKSDYCQVCGFDGEIIINKDNEWECPNCGNKDRNRMNVTRRTCGYLGEHWWNEGKTKEIKDRVVHLDNIEDCSCNC